MSKIAITGTIASGKTSASIYLRSLGYYVFDCDEYNKYLLEKNNRGYLKVKEVWPSVIKDEEIDKKALSDIVFNSQKDKKKLEDIMHPLIKEELLRQANIHDLFFAEVPLLFETDFYKLFDSNWLVYADFETCIKRLLEKGYTEKEAIERLNSQMSIDQKLKMADEILYNNKDFSYLNRQIDGLLKDVR